MSCEMITREDLDQFRIALLKDIQLLLNRHIPAGTKPLLKNSEVKKLLSLSESKLQRLRIQGLLTSKKIGGVHYYRYADIEKMITHPKE